VNEKLMECLSNPIKNKLLTTIKDRERVTTKELAEIVNQLPQTTLYRYLKKMVNDGLIKVVEENRVRNVNEKVYGMAIDFDAELKAIAEDVSSAASIAQFQRFVNGLVDEFKKNLPEGEVNSAREDYGFFIGPIHASRDETKELIEKIREVIRPYEQNELTADRHLQSFAMIITPPCMH